MLVRTISIKLLAVRSRILNFAISITFQVMLLSLRMQIAIFLKYKDSSFHDVPRLFSADDDLRPG